MELSDVLALVKAGYTREEISKMEPTPEATQELEPVAAPVAAPVATPVAAPVAEPKPETQVEPQANQPTLSEIMQGIAKLTSAVQANAIASSVLPQTQQSVTAEDMLAEIIRPTFKERGI